jgi:hypothetical protein
MHALQHRATGLHAREFEPLDYLDWTTTGYGIHYR